MGGILGAAQIVDMIIIGPLGDTWLMKRFLLEKCFYSWTIDTACYYKLFYGNPWQTVR